MTETSKFFSAGSKKFVFIHLIAHLKLILEYYSYGRGILLSKIILICLLKRLYVTQLWFGRLGISFTVSLITIIVFQWMVRRWTKYLGQEEAIKLMKWNNSDPTYSLRFLDLSVNIIFPFIFPSLEDSVTEKYLTVVWC